MYIYNCIPVHIYIYMTAVFNSCAHPLCFIIALPGNLPGNFPDLAGLWLFDMPGNGARNGPEKRN